MKHNNWSNLEEVSNGFSSSSVKFQDHTGQKIADFDPNWVFLDIKLKFEFTDGFEIMHKAWSSIEQVPCCFSRSSVKLQGHTEKNQQFWP